MNLSETLSRLPEKLRAKLLAHPAIQARLKEGEPLESAVGGAEWARRWAAVADTASRALLEGLIRTFAGLPIGEEAAEARLARATDLTGAEIRVSLARLRRDGILFAVRKAWGNRLLYVPSDMVGVWQLTLCPPTAEPLPEEREGAVEVRSPARLPLSLELLQVWADIRRRGFPLTAKGAPHKAHVQKLASGMRLTAEEIADSGILGEGGQPVPANVALALDIGLCAGRLVRDSGGIAAKDELDGVWADKPLCDADAALLDLATARYGGQEAGLHWAATALRGLKPGRWYLKREALREPGAEEREALGKWLKLMASFGWMELGMYGDETAFRWRIDPAPQRFRSDEPAFGPIPSEGVAFFVQPDLEVIVPPETSFGARWKLERIADRMACDVVSIYRLTRASCVRAGEAGFGFADVAAWLERASGMPLAEPARRTLEDWFGRIGKLSISDAKLLRVENEELADRIARDAQAEGLLLERLGSRAFAVKPDGVKELTRRLNELGYPPAVETAPSPSAASSPNGSAPGKRPKNPPAPGTTDPGWIRRGPALSLYEPDESIPGREDLFPGLDAVPAAWVQRPGRYHVSTRRELVERAIAWRTGLKVKQGDRWFAFVPETLTSDEGGWKVAGRRRGFEDGETAADRALELSADNLDELMIELPLEPAGASRTNR